MRGFVGLMCLSVGLVVVGMFRPQPDTKLQRVKAADLEVKPEASLYYPGFNLVKRTAEDEKSSGFAPFGGDSYLHAAEVRAYFRVPEETAEVLGWYKQELDRRGWQPDFSNAVCRGDHACYRRGDREIFEVGRANQEGFKGHKGTGIIYYMAYRISPEKCQGKAQCPV
jgi:hypothetical protein